MNKILTAMIAVIALLTLTACGGDHMTKPMSKSMMTSSSSHSASMK